MREKKHIQTYYDSFCIKKIILKIIYTRKLHTIFIDRENSFGKEKHSQLQETQKLFNLLKKIVTICIRRHIFRTIISKNKEPKINT